MCIVPMEELGYNTLTVSQQNSGLLVIKFVDTTANIGSDGWISSLTPTIYRRYLVAMVSARGECDMKITSINNRARAPCVS